MASALFGLSRALTARSAAISRSAVRARPAPHAQTPAFVAGVRFYRGEELDRRMRTLLIHNVPWEMTLEEVQQELQPFRGFLSVEPIEDRDGSFKILFTDKDAKTHARRVFLKISWQGRAIIPVSEHTDSEPPKPARSLYISGIPRNATHAELNEFFSGVEGHEKIRVPKSTQWDGYIGFALMLFGSVEQATKAIELLHGRWIGDSKVWVNYSRLPPPREKRARNADRVRNPKKEEKVEVGASEKELKKREMAAAARARRKAREEGEMAGKRGEVADGSGGSALDRKEASEASDESEDREAAADAWSRVKAQAQRKGLGARRQDKGLDRSERDAKSTAKRQGTSAARAGRRPRPGVKAQIMGIADAMSDELEASAKDGSNGGATAISRRQAEEEAVVSAIEDDLTDKPSEAGVTPSDVLAAKARDEAGKRIAAEMMDEASARIAAARARRKAREEARAGEREGGVTDKPSETEPAKKETAEAKDKPSEA